MKKFLFATTALVAFSGAASAEIALSGSAEMGVSGGTGMETLFHQSLDITFAMTGESDSGLSFGATIDLEDALDRAAAGFDTTDDRGVNPDYTVFISGAFGTLTMGDTDGALDWAVTDAGDIGNPGSLADDETSHAGYFGDFGDEFAGGQVLRYDYSFGAFGFAISAEQDPTGTFDPTYALGVKYTLDLGGTTINLGAGYQNMDVVDADLWTVSVDGSFAGGFVAGIEYSRGESPILGDMDHVGVGVGYSSGPIALHANYGVFDYDAGGEDEGFGLAAAYDLGGGLSINGGYGHSEFAGGGDADTWSLGLKMSF